MKENELKKFIFEASRASYASGDDSIKHKEADGSTTITYSSGEYRMHDNYFGGEPYGGREVVFLNNKVKIKLTGFSHDLNKQNMEVTQINLNNTLELINVNFLKQFSFSSKTSITP